MAHHIPIQNLALVPDHLAPILGHYPDLVQDPVLGLVLGHAPTLGHLTPAGLEVEVAAIDQDHALQHSIVLAVDLHHIEVGK